MTRLEDGTLVVYFTPYDGFTAPEDGVVQVEIPLSEIRLLLKPEFRDLL